MTVENLLKTVETVRDSQKILLLLREFQKIDPEFPLQYAVCLLQISLNEGLSLTDLSKKTGLSLSTLSRIVGALSKSRQKGSTAYELVEVKVCETERRKKELYLTEKGHHVIDGLVQIARIL